MKREKEEIGTLASIKKDELTKDNGYVAVLVLSLISVKSQVPQREKRPTPTFSF